MSESPEKEPPDVRTPEGWKEALEIEKAVLLKLARTQELLITVTTLFCEEDPEGIENWRGAPRPYNMFCIAHGADEEVDRVKDAFSTEVSLVSVAGSAIATMTSSEAWMAMIEADSVEEGRKKMKGRPRDTPGRKEVLTLMHSHREFGYGMLMCEISHKRRSYMRKPKRVFGEWKESPGQMSEKESRFLFRPPPQIGLRPDMKERARAVLEAHRAFQRQKGIMIEKKWNKE